MGNQRFSLLTALLIAASWLFSYRRPLAPRVQIMPVFLLFFSLFIQCKLLDLRVQINLFFVCLFNAHDSENVSIIFERSPWAPRGFIRSWLSAVNRPFRRLLNLTFKRVVVIISSTQTGRNNYESLYFILEFAAVQLPTYYLWPSTKKNTETPGTSSPMFPTWNLQQCFNNMQSTLCTK